MPGVFRRRWFPRLRQKGAPGRVDATFALTGVSTTSQVGTLSQNVNSNRLLGGVAATAQIGAPRSSITFTLTGVEATTQVGTSQEANAVNLTGVAATTQVGSNAFLINSNVHMIGVSAPSSAGTLTGDHPVIFPIGVQAVANSGVMAGNHSFFTLVGVQATTQFPATVVTSHSVTLTGVQALTQVPSSPFFHSPTFTLNGVGADTFPGTFHFAGLFRLTGQQATTQVGQFSGGSFPSDRVFVIAGRNQQVLPPGTAMYPTSETVNLGSNPYIIASSQFYTIGQVSWGSVVRTEGVDWQLVDPFTHIIEILTLPSVGTPIELIFFRWDIGVTAGFEVTSYPVQFSFLDTTIIAEKIPTIGQFFTVNFVRERPLANPTTFFAIYPLIVDDVWQFHAQYDAPNGFQTYRPAGYRVLDLALSRVFEWDGNTWQPSTVLVTGTKFYVKALRGVYILEGSAILPVFEAGDPVDPMYPQALTYPNYGEGIGKNLLVDAFSPNAAIDYPAAYEVAISPGDFDPWA